MLINQNLFGKVNKVKQAIRLLRDNEPLEGYYLAFSGGKDSIAIYYLAKMARVKFDAHYSFTTVDPPEVVAFVKQFRDIAIEYPKNNMWGLIEKFGPPDRNARFCCRELKENGGKGRIVLTGVRAEESAKRAERAMIEKAPRKKVFVKAIFEWHEGDVWEFIEKYNLPYCSLYDQGYSRVGCVGCPLKSTKLIERDFERYPLYKAAYMMSFDKWLKNKPEKKIKWETAEEVFDWWLYGKKVKSKDQLVIGWDDIKK